MCIPGRRLSIDFEHAFCTRGGEGRETTAGKGGEEATPPPLRPIVAPPPPAPPLNPIVHYTTAAAASIYYNPSSLSLHTPFLSYTAGLLILGCAEWRSKPPLFSTPHRIWLAG